MALETYRSKRDFKTTPEPCTLVRASVAAPLDWTEVKRHPQPIDFTIKNMPGRLAKKGDLFTAVLNKRQTIGTAIQQLIMKSRLNSQTR